MEAGIFLTKEELDQMLSEAAEKAAEKAVKSVPMSMSVEAAKVPEPKEEDRFLRGYDALCEYLNIGRTTLWRLKKAKKIPFIQRGKVIYFDKREIDKKFFRC